MEDTSWMSLSESDSLDKHIKGFSGDTWGKNVSNLKQLWNTFQWAKKLCAWAVLITQRSYWVQLELGVKNQALAAGPIQEWENTTKELL